MTSDFERGAKARVRLLQCFMSNNLSHLEFEDGTTRYFEHRGSEYTAYEGRWGTALFDGPVLLEFRPDPL